jgi:hypothetical protein
MRSAITVEELLQEVSFEQAWLADRLTKKAFDAGGGRPSRLLKKPPDKGLRI